MKKCIFSLLAFVSIACAQAQFVNIKDDTSFLSFRTDYLWDTVDLSDTFYVFNEKPDTGLGFFARLQKWPTYLCGWDTITDITGLHNDVDTFRFPELLNHYRHLAQKYHIDSTATLYGVAMTIYPSVLRYYGMRGDSSLAACTEMTEYMPPYNKNITQTHFDLLQKVYDGTDSVMKIIDSVWLDSENLIKRCYFKYEMTLSDSTYFETYHQKYFPGLPELAVPCVELYFDNPFDSLHTISGDFYVGSSNLNAPDGLDDGINHYARFVDNDDEFRNYFPQPFYPYYPCDKSGACKRYVFSYDDTGRVVNVVDSRWFSKTTFYGYPWGVIFPITGLRCGQLHHVQLAEKGEAYALWTWQGGEDDDETPMYQIRLIDNRKEDGGVIASSTQSDTSYMCTGLDEYGDYTFKIRKRCHYATSHYDTVVWSDWYSYPFVMKEKPVDTTTVDTTIVDTTIVDTTIVDTTGIRLSLGDADYSLSPNPAHGSAVLRLQYPVAETDELTLFDMRGREVRRLTLKRGTKTVRLDLQGLPSGAYLLKLLTPRGLSTRRLLVQ